MYDVFVSLTESGLDEAGQRGYLDRLDRALELSPGCGRVTVASTGQPEGSIGGADLPASVLLERAIIRAATLHRHLVVLLGALVPHDEMLGMLFDALEIDPMFGSAQPRFCDAVDGRIWPLPSTLEPALVGLRATETVLAHLPPYEITAELLAGCMVLRWSLLAATTALDHNYDSLAGTLLHLLCQSRRRGLRNAVVNRAVLNADVSYCRLYPTLAAEDQARLQAAYPEHVLAESELAVSAQRRVECLLSAAIVAPKDRRILLDCRGMGPVHNGSSQAILGMLDGFDAHQSAPQIDILALSDAARFHRLPDRYSRFRLFTAQPTGAYFAAVRLTQPWALSTIVELHRHALVVGFTMLDTIAWDVLHPSAQGVEVVWRFIARHADVLVFTSHYTRGRFKTRFPTQPSVRELTTHHSLRAEEYVDPEVCGEPSSERIVVFGNEYDHKDLRPTVQLLVDAFPFAEIVAFGTDQPLGRNVAAIPSGQLEAVAVHRLIASARVLVYPSYYEGFGLPVVEGLAYGRPVVVRRSPLWTEIASWSRLPGELIEFDDGPSLVEGVGRVLAGMPTRAAMSGTELHGGEPESWGDSAASIIGLLEDGPFAVDGSRWTDRDEALRVAGF